MTPTMILLCGILVGPVSITSYRSVPSQTDSSPFITSIGERVHPHGIAVSQNLLKRWGGPLNYGDMVYIEGVGFKIVNDVMNPRHKNAIDVWVTDLNAEKKFHKQWAGKKTRIWQVNEPVIEGKAVPK